MPHPALGPPHRNDKSTKMAIDMGSLPTTMNLARHAVTLMATTWEIPAGKISSEQ